MRRVVVIGNGMAGARFVQDLLEYDLDRACAVTVIGDEPGGAYNRVLLSNVLAGVTRADAIELIAEGWYADQGVRLLSGVTVTAVDRTRRTVTLDDGTELPYDVLVLATGSTAFVPPMTGLYTDEGVMLDGAALFRTRADCAALDRWAARARRIVVVGAGVLGLEAARGLAGRGRWVTVVQREARLMERQLDAAAGTALGRTLDGLGVEVLPETTVAQVHGRHRVEGVTLSDGRHRDADMLVLCCGVRPRVELAVEAGLAVARGVVVDDRLRSVTDSHVVAIGECAEHDGRVYGLVAPVWEQARVAAATVADEASAARYAGSVQVTRLKAAGVELAAIGDSTAVEDDVELVTVADTRRGVYQKLVVREGRLAGAILLGDTRNAGNLVQLFERGAAVPDDLIALLVPRHGEAVIPAAASPTALPARATICACNGVSKAAICSAWQDGARSTAEVAARTRATTGCGGCRDVVDGLVEWLDATDPDDDTVDDPSLAALLDSR